MSQAQLNEQAKAHGVLLSVCCECEAVYGGSVVDHKFAGLSHGLCTADYLKAKAQLAQRRAA